jgi:hypothetical protein
MWRALRLDRHNKGHFRESSNVSSTALNRSNAITVGDLSTLFAILGFRTFRPAINEYMAARNNNKTRGSTVCDGNGRRITLFRPTVYHDLYIRSHFVSGVIRIERRGKIFFGLELVSMELIKRDCCSGLPYKGSILCRTLSLGVIQSDGTGAGLLAKG